MLKILKFISDLLYQLIRECRIGYAVIFYFIEAKNVSIAVATVGFFKRIENKKEQVNM